MKATLYYVSTCLAICLAVAGCETESTRPSDPHRAAVHKGGESETKTENENAPIKPPKIGMTKAQVRARYGEPDSITATANGEVWGYIFNQPGAKRFIPFYEYATAYQKPQSGSIIFGENGRVKNYSMSQRRSIGHYMWGGD